MLELATGYQTCSDHVQFNEDGMLKFYSIMIISLNLGGCLVNFIHYLDLHDRLSPDEELIQR